MLFDNTLVNVAPKKWNNIGGSISPFVYSFMQNKFSNIILIGVTDSIYLYNNFQGTLISTFAINTYISQPMSQYPVFKLISVSRYYGMIFISCSFSYSPEDSSSSRQVAVVQLIKISINQQFITIISELALKLTDFGIDPNTAAQLTPFNAFDVVLIEETFYYAFYVRGFNKLQIYEGLTATLVNTYIFPSNIQSVSSSFTNPNDLLIFLDSTQGTS